MIYYDTETCGLHGFPVLIQYAINDGPVHLYNIWENPVEDTLNLIEGFMEQGVVGFNLTFDHFHLIKAYTTLRLLPPDFYPVDDPQLVKSKELEARDGPTLKPRHALDLMLHARKGPYQCTMDRKDLRVKRVPSKLAPLLCDELNKRIKFPDILFARSEKLEHGFKHDFLTDEKGNVDPNFQDIVLRFAPSAALKALVSEIFGDKTIRFQEVGVHEKFYPSIDKGWAPAHNNWHEVIDYHIDHWEVSQKGRRYAELDVIYTRWLHWFFSYLEMGVDKDVAVDRIKSDIKPTELIPPDDTDSILSCMVPCVRWKGFKVDLDQIRTLKQQAAERTKLAPTSPGRVKEYIFPELTESEKLDIGYSTNKIVLKVLSKYEKDCDCVDIDLVPDGFDFKEVKRTDPGCKECGGKGTIPHPVQDKAKDVIAARTAAKEEELYDKILEAGRLHASTKVIGTLSSRMSGADGLNVQGIKKDEYVRKCFPLAPDGYVLSGGDFDGYEVTIFIAAAGDETLEAEVRAGKKVHALFGMEFEDDLTYEDVINSKGQEVDWYAMGKSGVFLKMFGGTAHTFVERIGLSMEQAERADTEFDIKYPGVGKYREKIERDHNALSQPDGIGKRVFWNDPKEYVESLNGHRRYYTYENMVMKELFDLANDVPASWKKLDFKVIRRDREQRAYNAVQSALFAAAFAIQGRVERTASNHIIQSTGAIETKEMQRAIWDLQPVGVHEILVMPLNIHDEVMCPNKIPDEVANAVEARLVETRKIIPLAYIGWGKELESWASKT